MQTVEDITGRVLIDTNVLLYATFEDDPRHQRARDVIELRQRKDIEVFISVQNLAEMYPNLTGPKSKPPNSPELARRKIESIAALRGVQVLPVTMETVSRALKLCEAHGTTRQRYFDMQITALMLDEGIRTVITENLDDFTGIDGIQALNPFS